MRRLVIYRLIKSNEILTKSFARHSEKLVKKWLRMLQNTIFIADYTEQIVRIRSFSGPYFPAFELNADQKNSKYGHFSRSTKYKYKISLRSTGVRIHLKNLINLLIIKNLESFTLQSWTKYSVKSGKIQQNWTKTENFDICFYVLCDYCWENFISGRETRH